jgi:dynein heavy chain
LKKIFGDLAQFKFHNFPEEIKALCEPLAVASIQLFNTVSENFLPTPAKSHYVFNMRDISKVFQGLYMAQKANQDTKEHLIKLWGHEIMRVFHDRLISVDDQNLLKSILNEQLQQHFQMEYKEHCMTKGENDAIFVDFLQSEDTANYEEVINFDQLRTYLVDKLSAYNQQPKVQKMNIVLFREAIIHIAKIYRVLNQPRGHVLLVGVGGSGRHSLTRLCSYIARMNCDQLEIRRDFTLKDFRTKLKELYELSAFKGKWFLKTVFIFSDNDVVQESFLEDIQNTLNSGVVPNLYAPDELNRIREEGLIMKKYKEAGNTNEAPDAVHEWFFNRVKDNMHLSICMSPVGETFRSYCRQYPALINNTTIDWFMAWPEEALIEVASKFLNDIDLPDEKRGPLANMCGFAHAFTQK